MPSTCPQHSIPKAPPLGASQGSRGPSVLGRLSQWGKRRDAEEGALGAFRACLAWWYFWPGHCRLCSLCWATSFCA